MKIRLLLYALCLVFLLGSCTKEKTIQQSTQTKHAQSPPKPTQPITVYTKLSLASVLQSNMVVQRNKAFTIWGNAPVSAQVTVNVSWNTGNFNATTDSLGNWQVTIPATSANANPQTITAKTTGSDAITLTNILIGDVWICSGQSNMVYTIDSTAAFRGVIDYPDVVAAANYPNIRVLTIQADTEDNPVDTFTYAANWKTCTPVTAGRFSAVAYFFAQKLYTSLNVPIGIVISAVRSTSCEEWLNNAAFLANPYLDKYASVVSKTCYNGMINPITNLSIKGFIWYQGENNRHNNPPGDYTQLNSALILAWRKVFGQGSLPFYFVQLPGYDENYFMTDPVGGYPQDDDYAKFREAQAGILAVPNTGMAVTMDVGEPDNEHPRNKQPVGERLALLALNNTYGQNVQCYGPRYSSYTATGNTVTINFVAGTAEGLNTIGNLPLKQYFYVAGPDKNFVQATAVISGNQIILTAPPSTPLPIQAVRYAFTVAPVTNLQNNAALPMEPFRTDNWDN